MTCSNCGGDLRPHAVWGVTGHRDGLRCGECGAEYEADGSAIVAAPESSGPLPEAAAAVDDSEAEEPTPAPDASESPAPEKRARRRG